MKFSSSRSLVFLVTAILLIPHASAQIIQVPDPNLESAIRERLKLPNEVPITQTEMLRLERLNAKGAEIENINGLEHATNLKSLELAVNNIQDITPVKGLVKLESLSLRKNPITDLTPLANLTNLTYINLAAVKLSDITPLANLTKLKQAWLMHMQLQDITPLANLTQLIALSLANNQIVDISPLANLTQLEELYIDRNQVVDVSPLANLTQLTALTIANNPIADFRPLFGLNLQSVDVDIHALQELASSDVEILDPNLKHAVRERLELPDEVPITQLQMLRLKKLTAKEAEIENINGLEHAINLRSLVLPVNQIQDITPLTNLVNLNALNLDENDIRDITPLTNLVDLNSLRLAENDIQDITPLTNLVNLNALTLRENPIQDISPIANLTKLTDLNLSGVIIEDLTPLSNLTQLEELHATYCQITDITPLADLTQLVVLNLRANQIVDVTPLANLTQLEKLSIPKNSIVDFSPLQGLSLTDFRYDEECLLPDRPILDRIQNRSLPSTSQGWGLVHVNQPHLSREERLSYHDIHWGRRPFGLRFLQLNPEGYQVRGEIALAIAKREEMAARNPNRLSLRTIRQRDARVNVHYPEDWPYWLRDDEGNPVRNHRKPDVYLINLTLPEVQDIIVEQAIASSKCGLYDGIFFDWWGESAVLVNYLADPPIFYKTHEEEREARISILQRIRANVPDDFLIVCNLGDRARPLAAPLINGGFMETDPDDPERGYTRDEIIVIENNLIWREENLREPQLNCLQGVGIPSQPYESPTNKRVMRLFTTMSLTLSDGYVHFVNGILGQHVHFRYPFLDADLGQPISPTAQQYQDVEGLYIREFTNGWAAYNRSGQAQTIALPSSATPVGNGDLRSATTFLLPDLDGEIYLKTPSAADVNRDGKINILDLLQVANSIGEAAPDPNGDGVVNTLDLVFITQQFNQ